ncbi:MAG TPA: hypothetical protein VF092_13225 [Longimicrobium sp.]
MTLYVREFRPRAWFLLGDQERAEDWYLDVNCDQGAAGFSLLVKLSETEREEHRVPGRVFIEYLAARIAAWPEQYRDRDLTREMGGEVTDAIVKFKQARTDVDW